MGSWRDEFEFSNQRTEVICHSKSGNDYTISIDQDGHGHCECKSFKMRGWCRHFNEANVQGLIVEILKNRKATETKVRDQFCRGCGRKFDVDDNFCGRCGKERA